jgi:hypothetical protein
MPPPLVEHVLAFCSVFASGFVFLELGRAYALSLVVCRVSYLRKVGIKPLSDLLSRGSTRFSLKHSLPENTRISQPCFTICNNPLYIYKRKTNISQLYVRVGIPVHSCPYVSYCFLVIFWHGWHLTSSVLPFLSLVWIPVAVRWTATTVSSFILLACWTPGLICVPNEFTALPSFKALHRCLFVLS